MLDRRSFIIGCVFASTAVKNISPAQARTAELDSNNHELLVKLRTARGGEIIDLAGQNFGDFSFSEFDFGNPVTLTGGTFDSLRLSDVHNIHFRDVHVLGSTFVRNGGEILFDRCLVKGGKFGLVLRGVKNSSVVRSLITGQVTDNVRIAAGCDGILFEDNALLNGGGSSAHLDLLQMFGIRNQGIPRNISIRRNFLWSRPKDGERARQGLFITDPNNGDETNEYRDILVEQNIIWASNKNTLVMTWAGENCVVRNNTLRGSGNLLVNERVRTEQNLILQAGRGLPNSFNDVAYDKLGNIFPGSRMVWQDQVPLIEMGNTGAVELIEHLRNGRAHGLDLVS